MENGSPGWDREQARVFLDSLGISHNRLMTAREVADLLGFRDQGTVYRYADAGRLRWIRVGARSKRFLPEDVAGFLVQGLEPFLWDGNS